METTKTALRERVAELCSLHINQTMTDYSDIGGMMVTTSDGHVVESVLGAQLETSDLAAMSSSLMALSETVCARTKLAPANNVVINGSNGKIVCMRITRGLILTSVAPDAVNLGMQLSASMQLRDGILAGLAELNR